MARQSVAATAGVVRDMRILDELAQSLRDSTALHPRSKASNHL